MVKLKASSLSVYHSSVYIGLITQHDRVMIDCHFCNLNRLEDPLICPFRKRLRNLFLTTYLPATK